MATFRIIDDGAIKDYDRFIDVAERARDFVEANEPEPDTLAWECYADEASGIGLLEESYTDEAAFLTHFQNSVDHGFVNEILKIFEPQNLRVLASITDPQTRHIIDRFGATQLQQVQRLTR